MAQQISIQRVTESEEILCHFDINVAEIVNMLWQIQDFKEEFPWLSTIDPYGNTSINLLQKPYFAQELSRFAQTTQGSKVIELIEKFKIILTETEMHQYVKLIGD